MKLKSLILGSVAAAGLTSGAFAADLNVLTSLDVCDLLGISGLTISSDTNCLQISGGADADFQWGDYDANAITVAAAGGAVNFSDNGGVAPAELDWRSRVNAWLKFVGTAQSDFGPASATIKLDFDRDHTVTNEAAAVVGIDRLRVENAYVSVGDQTVLMAGLKGSILNYGDDEPLNFLGLFNSEGVDAGVASKVMKDNTNHSIQIVSNLGDGLSVGFGLENLDGTEAAGSADDGNMVGVVSYAANGISAHVSGVAGGFLDGTVESFGVHAGLTATIDQFKFVGAFAADNANYWNALASASATFDMFTIAASGELVNNAGVSQAGFGGSVGAAVTDTVSINLGARYFDENTAAANTETWQAAIQIVAAVTETVTLTGEVGLVNTNNASPVKDLYYGKATVAYAPGGGFTTSVTGEMNSAGAYKISTKAAKSFN